MKRKFSDRVAIERQVLTIINEHFEIPLNGLTASAISRWIASNHDISDRISDLVKKISQRSSLEVDASRDIFTNGELEAKHSTGSYIKELEIELKKSTTNP